MKTTCVLAAIALWATSARAEEFETEPASVPQSVGASMQQHTADSFAGRAPEALRAPAQGVVDGAGEAWKGNEWVPGLKAGTERAGTTAKDAGQRWKSAVDVSSKAARIVADAKRTAGEVAVLPAEKNAETRKQWSAAMQTVAANGAERDDALAVIGEDAANGRALATTDTRDSVAAIRARVDGDVDAIDAWRALQWTAAKEGLLEGTPKRMQADGAATVDAAKEAQERTSDAIDDVPGWSRALWAVTKESTSSTATAAGREGGRIVAGTQHGAGGVLTWLHETRTPVGAMPEVVQGVTTYNWDRGWVNGANAGIRTAKDAWQNDDRWVAALWLTSGLGKAALHLGLLEPVMVPLLALSALGASAAMFGGVYCVAATWFTGGIAMAGAALAAGVLAAMMHATFGTVLSGLGGVAAAVRAGFVALFGVAWTAGVAAMRMLLTTSLAVFDAARIVAVPLLGFFATSAVYALGVAGATAFITGGILRYAGASMAGVGRSVIVTGLQTAANVPPILGALVGATVSHGIVLPAQTVAAFAMHAGRTTADVVVDPAVGSALLLAATGLLGYSGVTSALVFGLGTAKGTLSGAWNGVVAGGAAVGWLGGGSVKGAEFVGRALDIPQHREWADVQRPSVETFLDEVKPALQGEAGDDSVSLIRVHFWGKDTGRVRFFVTRNARTGDHRYFRRSVDAETCEVIYDVSRKDPIARFVDSQAWEGHYRTGRFVRACVESREQGRTDVALR